MRDKVSRAAPLKDADTEALIAAALDRRNIVLPQRGLVSQHIMPIVDSDVFQQQDNAI
jgi:hypothetical protein